MSSLKVTQIAPRHLRGTTFIGQDGSTTHFHPHSRVILHEYATKEWILEMLGELEGADLSELVTKKYAHATFGEIFLGKTEPLGIKVTDLWFDTNLEEQHLKMCSQIDRDPDGNVIKQHWINVAPRPSVDDDVEKLKVDVLELGGELEALIDVTEKGSWTTKAGDVSVDPVGDGEIMFSPTNFDAASFTIKMSTKDGDGKTHNFALIDVEETYIEFVQDNSDYLLFRPSTINLDEPGMVIMEGSGEIGKGVAADGESNDVRAFKTDITVDLSSLMPKSGGKFTGSVTHTKDIVIQPGPNDNRFVKIRNEAPRNADGGPNYSGNFGVQVDLSAGTTDANIFKITGNNGTDMLYAAGRTLSIKYYGDKSSGQNLATQSDIQSLEGNISKGYTLTSNWDYSMKWLSTPQSCNSDQFCTGNPYSHSTSLYLYRLKRQDNAYVRIQDYNPGPNATYEITEKWTGDVITRGIVASVVDSNKSSSDALVTLRPIWINEGYAYNTGRLYNITLTDMVYKK